MQIKLKDYLDGGQTFSSIARGAGLTPAAVSKMLLVGRNITVQQIAPGKLALFEQKRVDKNPEMRPEKKDGVEK